MRALVCESWRPYDELELKEVPEPVLTGPQDVRVKINHCGVSWATNLVVTGRYQRKPPLPFSPGTEISGVVVETGSEVKSVAKGDRVCAVLDYGGCAGQAVVHARHIFSLPPQIPLDVSVALPISYMTAYGALVWRGKAKAGDKILIHGAAGGVGLAAVDIALALGCKVFAVVKGEQKAEFLRKRGAHHVIERSTTSFRDYVRDSTKARGVDIVVDTIGGPVLSESLRCLDDDGRHLVIGFVHGEIPQIPANILLLKNISTCGFNLGQYIGWGVIDERERYADRYRLGMEQLLSWTTAGTIKPTIHARYPLDEFRDAMEVVTRGDSLGRVLLDI